MSTLIQHLKQSDSQFAKHLLKFAKRLYFFELPRCRWLFSPLNRLVSALALGVEAVGRIFFYTPRFKAVLSNDPRGIYLYSGMPQVLGSLKITVGDNTRISGISTFSGRSATQPTPELVIGSNVDIGWQNTIAVGTKVVIEDNVRLAGRVHLAGYPGHPVEPQARAMGLPDLDAQAKDIILQQDVWLATGVTVLAGVTIGKGSIIAAGSVVTKDIPAGVLAGGNPARVIKSLESNHD